MHHSTCPEDRYYVQAERAPRARPRGWRPRYFVIDRLSSDQRPIERYARWGEADHRAQCLNGTLSPFLCRTSASASATTPRLAAA